MPLPHAKTIFINLVTSHASYTSSYSTLFEDFIKDYLPKRASWEKRCLDNKTSFEKFEKAVVSIISTKEKSKVILDFAENALKSTHEQLAKLVSERLFLVFPTLKSIQQQQIVKSIISTTAETDLYYDSIGLLQSLPLTSETFVALLAFHRIGENEDGEDFTKRRRRRSSTTNKAALQKEEVSHAAERHLKKLTITLEALDFVKPDGSGPLLSALFNALSDLETLDQDGGLPVLYAQETLASCMISTISSLKVESKTSLRHIRADILISAITSSQSPQVQNKLLLVIGELAKICPETVLHSVMPIFIFMGAQTIRQDDEYSTFVVEKTIQTVVPALVQSKTSGIAEEIEFLLTSFATAFTHVPKHRRVKLFTTLVKTLGPDKAIGPFIFLISQQYSSLVNKFKIAESRSVLEFMRAFLSRFDVLDQLSGLDSFFALLNILSERYPDDLKVKLAFVEYLIF